MKKITNWIKEDITKLTAILFSILIIPVFVLGIIFPAGTTYQNPEEMTLFYLVTIGSLSSAVFGMLNILVYSRTKFDDAKKRKKVKYYYLAFNAIALISLTITDFLGKRYVNLIIDGGLIIAMILQFLLWYQNDQNIVFSKLYKTDILKYSLITIGLIILFSSLEYLIIGLIMDGSTEPYFALWCLLDGISGSLILTGTVLLSKKKFVCNIFFMLSAIINIIYFWVGFKFRFGSPNFPLIVLFMFYLGADTINYINWRFILNKK